jgi:hypothetical protein
MPTAAIGPISSGSSADRLPLHDLVEHLVKSPVVGWKGIHHLAGPFMDHRRRRRGDAAELGLARQERGDGRTDTARLVGVDFELGPDRFDRRLRIALVRNEHAAEPPVEVGAGASHIEPAVGQLALIVRRHDQVFAALATVGSGNAGVGHPAKPGVVDAAEHPGRHFHHHWPLAEVEHRHDVHRVRVRRQEQRLGVHQLGEHDDLVVLDAGVHKTLAQGLDADALQRVSERAERVREVEVVVDLLDRRLARHAVLELQRADPCLDPVRRDERWRDWWGRLGYGLTSAGH